MSWSRYRRGRDFEYVCKWELERRGFVVFRCAGSKPFDLIAFSPSGRVYFIECRLSGKISKSKREVQEELAERCGATYVILTREDYMQKIEGLSRNG